MTRSKSLAAVALVSIGAVLGAAATHWWMKRPEQVRRQFHLLYHKLGSQTFNNTRWLGVPAQKCPLDMWVLQEILHETQPDVLVETGTYKGGSAYYYASLFDLMNHGRIITVDIEDQPEKPAHPRITYLLGSSTGAATVAKVKELIRPGEKVMVLLDSDHTGSHVKRELDLYSPLVTPGAYLIVEDTHFNGHPILPNHGPGPWEAVQEFLTGNAEFAVDNQREKFLLTFNPDGFLRRR